MPGRVKLTCEASVDTQPASASTKRKILATLQCPVAKRARDDDTAAAAVLSGESSRAQSPADTPATTPPSSQAVKRPTPKKKQVSKPRDKKFACTHDGCDKSFTRPCRLEEHLRSHTGDRPFKCTSDPETCDKSFLRDSHLKAHVKAMHSKEKPYRCTFLIPPGKEADRGEFGFKRKASEPAEGEGDYGAMKECGARFSTNQHLKRHVESHLKTFPYICKDYPPCSAGFRKKGPLTRHVRSEHLGLHPWACLHKDASTGNQCAISFDTKGKLGNHVAIQHNGLTRRRYICTICITSPASAPVDQSNEHASLLLSLSQQRAPTPPPPPPPSGLRSEGMLGFTTHAELRAHIASAHPPVCSVCGYVAMRQNDLRSHCREMHEALEERQTWICGWDGCGLGFTKKSNLTTHTRSVHQGLKPFQCDLPECGKRFGHKAVLARHVVAKHTEKSSPSKAAKRKARRKSTKALGLAQVLTGVGYEDSGRNIECLVEGCQYRFVRMFDLRKHLGARSAHAFSEEQVVELMGLVKMATRLPGGKGKVEEDEEDEASETDSDEYESESDWSLAGSESDEDAVEDGGPVELEIR